MILKTLIRMLRCVWLGLELNSAGVGQIWGCLDYMLLWPFNKESFFLNFSPDVWLDANLFLSSTDCSFDSRACFLLWNALSAVGPFIKTCAFPNHTHSIEFATVYLQSKCSNIYKQYECPWDKFQRSIPHTKRMYDLNLTELDWTSFMVHFLWSLYAFTVCNRVQENFRFTEESHILNDMKMSKIRFFLPNYSLSAGVPDIYAVSLRSPNIVQFLV